MPKSYNRYLVVSGGDMSISKVIFLQKRAYGKDSGSLVASGPRGYIYFWNVFHGGRMLARFSGVSW